MNRCALSLLFILGSFACQAQAEKPAPEPAPAAKPVIAETRAPAAPATGTAPTAAPAAVGSGAAAGAGSVRTVAAGSGAATTVASSPEAKSQAGKPDQKPVTPAAPSERQAKRGTPASDEPFTAWLEGEVPLTAGQPATLRVVLQAKPPYHCNAEYPHKFTLAPAAGVTYPAPIAKGMQVTPAEGVLAVPIVAGPAGQATIKGNLAFSVCTEERCLVEKRELALDVDIR
jgi:hypothetical protein